jgi:mannose-6-phosphate isomerase-like protein (cupin superfamily)
MACNPINDKLFMKIAQGQAQRIDPTKNCTIWEYNFPSKHLSIARSHINGRYPDVGQVINYDCEEVYYVLDGSGIIHSSGTSVEIKPHDIFVFRKNVEYWAEGANLSLIVVNSPPWNPDHKLSL